MAVLFTDDVIFHTTRPNLLTVRWRKTTRDEDSVIEVSPWTTEGVLEMRPGDYHIGIPIEDTDPELTFIEVDTGQEESFGKVIKAMRFDPDTLDQVSSGGGVLKLKVAESSLAPSDYLELVQGELKVITFVVEAVGRFTTSSASIITAKFQDPQGNTVVKSTVISGQIERVCEEDDIQVIRVILEPDDTLIFEPGLLKIEVAFDDQKARGTHQMKVLESVDVPPS